MKSPRDRRPGAYREGVLQIHITRACDKSCFGCTQGSNLGGKPVMMAPEQFEAACQSLEGYWGVVGVFGGNPALHPQFDQICEILRRYFPKKQCGLWCNNLLGKGEHARATFNPMVSNLNVHLDQEAYDEFKRDWPESRPFGLHDDSRHSPPFVAMQDVIPDEEERWRLIGQCDVNQHWSAMVCTFRGELRGYFCELAGAQAMLHQHEPDYPDLGLPAVPGWWNQGMEAFDAQVRFHCHACGIPLRGYGELAIGGKIEEVSKTHLPIFKPKRHQGREVRQILKIEEMQIEKDSPATNYLQKAGAIWGR
jgi:hypothetical protein